MLSRHVGCLLWWEPKTLPLQQVKRVGIGIFQKFILDLSYTNSSSAGCLWVIITYILTNSKCCTFDFYYWRILSYHGQDWGATHIRGLVLGQGRGSCYLCWPRQRQHEKCTNIWFIFLNIFYNTCLYRYFVFLCILKCVINWLYRQMKVLCAVLPSSPLAERCQKSLVLR